MKPIARPKRRRKAVYGIGILRNARLANTPNKRDVIMKSTNVVAEL